VGGETPIIIQASFCQIPNAKFSELLNIYIVNISFRTVSVRALE